MRDLNSVADELALSVRNYVAETMGPIMLRLVALEAKLATQAAPRDGLNGADGKDGRDGRDADEAAMVERVLASVQTSAIDAVKGLFDAWPKPQDGRDGRDGKDGSNGFDGKDGKPGEQGIPGIAGKDGAPGTNGKDGRDGIDGKDGRDGLNGKDGAPGRDAAQIIPLASIDPTRNYPAGTWALHDGGLWRSAVQTDGMRGWECAMNGLADFDVQIDSEGRTVTIRSRLANGMEKSVEAHIPVPLDRGVYDEQQGYSKGDGVTWSGSWWIAQVDHPTERPGTGQQWRLAVKRGREGKQGGK